jgi:hypothetical protein
VTEWDQVKIKTLYTCCEQVEEGRTAKLEDVLLSTVFLLRVLDWPQKNNRTEGKVAASL